MSRHDVDMECKDCDWEGFQSDMGMTLEWLEAGKDSGYVTMYLCPSCGSTDVEVCEYE